MHFGIDLDLIYFWLEGALCQFLSLTFLLLVFGHLCLLLGLSLNLPSLMICVASLTRSLQMCLLIGAHLSIAAFIVEIVLLVFLVLFVHFLKVLCLRAGSGSIDIACCCWASANFWHKCALLKAFRRVQLSLSLELLI